MSELHWGDSMDLTSKLCVLKTKGGKFMTVQKFSGKRSMCAVDRQQSKKRQLPPVHIQTRQNDGINQMALRFQDKQDYYLLKVDGNGLELEKSADGNIPDNISDNHWFEKRDLGGGEHYGLQSVVSPRKYLSLDSRKRGRYNVFILSETEWVLVTDERVKQASITNSTSPSPP